MEGSRKMGIIDFIKKQVKSQGLRLFDLSKRTGIDPAYLSRIFNRHIAPSSNIVDKLLGAVNISCERMTEEGAHFYEIQGSIEDFTGNITDQKPTKISIIPHDVDFLIMLNTPPIIPGLNFPNQYCMIISKKEKINEGDYVYIVIKEKNKNRKMIRAVHFHDGKVTLRSISPAVLNITLGKKQILEMYKVSGIVRKF
jgi:transcriptional regulator with XRE-family HTH domain